MTRVLLLVGTKKGAFILESDADRREWSSRGPLCEGWPIHDLIAEPGERRDPGGGRQPVVRARPSGAPRMPVRPGRTRRPG